MSREEKLNEIVKSLPDEVKQNLLDYAEFLFERYGSAETLPDPEHVEAPENESVVAAIKRLSRTYSMLDKSKMLHETSALMAEHVMQGRNADAVISDLEKMFQKYYEKAKTGK